MSSLEPELPKSLPNIQLSNLSTAQIQPVSQLRSHVCPQTPWLPARGQATLPILKALLGQPLSLCPCCTPPQASLLFSPETIPIPSFLQVLAEAPAPCCGHLPPTPVPTARSNVFLPASTQCALVPPSHFGCQLPEVTDPTCACPQRMQHKAGHRDVYEPF